MLHSLHAQFQLLLAPALVQRLTLVINHVLAGEPVAIGKLKAHTGKRLCLVLENWPRLLPAAPVLDWRVTPAGLLDWSGAVQGSAVAVDAHPVPEAAVHDLTVRLDAGNPAALMARALGGQPPPVQVEGDAQFAGDINWLMQNLRWDVAADLERVFGPAVAQPLHQAGRMVASGLRAALQGATQGARGLGERVRAWRS